MEMEKKNKKAEDESQGWKQTGRERGRGVYVVFANQITLLCVNKTLNPFGITKPLNTITLAVI